MLACWPWHDGLGSRAFLFAYVDRPARASPGMQARHHVGSYAIALAGGGTAPYVLVVRELNRDGERAGRPQALAGRYVRSLTIRNIEHVRTGLSKCSIIARLHVPYGMYLPLVSKA